MTGLRVGDLSSNTSTVNKLTIFFFEGGKYLRFLFCKTGKKSALPTSEIYGKRKRK